jgi:hypothetical protein
LGRELWFHLDAPRHLSQFTPSSIGRLVSMCGFREMALRFFFPELNDLGMIQTVCNRIGFSPNFVFNMLKRNSEGLPATVGGISANAIGVVGMLGLSWPCLVLATRLEEMVGRGGTMIATARKPSPGLSR